MKSQLHVSPSLAFIVEAPDGKRYLRNFVGNTWYECVHCPSCGASQAQIHPEVFLHASQVGKLTRAENRILEELATPRTYEQIAYMRGVTERTVQFHASNIYEKLKVRNRAQLRAQYFVGKPVKITVQT